MPWINSLCGYCDSRTGTMVEVFLPPYQHLAWCYLPVCSGGNNSNKCEPAAAVWGWPACLRGAGTAPFGWSNTRFGAQHAALWDVPASDTDWRSLLWCYLPVVGLYLHGKWWLLDDVLRTSSKSRSGLVSVTVLKYICLDTMSLHGSYTGVNSEQINQSTHDKNHLKIAL